MYDFFWDLHQQRRIGEVEGKADEASRKATDFQERVRQLEDQIDRLTLVNQAMWSLLSGVIGITDKQLLDRVNELDLRDGVADGKITRTPAQCGKCHRTLHPRHKRCMYCGQPVAGRTAFDAV
jgi:hypothetical protein